MHCPNCGTKNVASVKFCKSCGHSLASQPKAVGRGVSPLIGFATGGCIVLVLLGCLLTSAVAANPAFASELPSFLSRPLTGFFEQTGLQVNLPPALQETLERALAAITGGGQDLVAQNETDAQGDGGPCDSADLWVGPEGNDNYIYSMELQQNANGELNKLYVYWIFKLTAMPIHGDAENYGLTWGWQDPANPADTSINLTGMNTNEENWCDLRGSEMHCGTYFPAPNGENLSAFFAENPRVVFASLGYTDNENQCELAAGEFVSQGEPEEGRRAVVYRDGQITTRVVVYRDGLIEVSDDANPNGITVSFGGNYSGEVCFEEWEDGYSTGPLMTATLGHFQLANSLAAGGEPEIYFYYNSQLYYEYDNSYLLDGYGQERFETEGVCSGGGSSSLSCPGPAHIVTSGGAEPALNVTGVILSIRGTSESISSESCYEEKLLEVPEEYGFVAAADEPESQQPTSGFTVTGITNNNCRSGPGSAYDNVGTLFADQTVNAIGRTADISWLVIEHPNNPSGYCWVFNNRGVSLEVNGEYDSLEIWDAPPLPDSGDDQQAGEDEEESTGDEGSDSGGESEGPAAAPLTFSVRNKTGDSICTVAISPAGEDNWDYAVLELDNNQTKSLTFNAVKNGYYDFYASNCAEGSGTETYSINNAQLIAGGVYVFLP